MLRQALKRAFLQTTFTRASPLVVVPQRMVHARGYNNWTDVYADYFHEANFALVSSKNTDNLVYVYQRYGHHMTPEQIMYGFEAIAKHRMENTQDFWELIIPTVKKQIETLDRQTCPALLMAIRAASVMYLHDNEFWGLVDDKLVNEGLYRYFELKDLATVLYCLAHVGRGSDEIVELIEKTFIKHRKGLTPDVIATAREGFNMLNKGSEIMHRVLNDPKTELPALE